MTNKDLFDLVNMLRDSLRDALPYVDGAYECAFPDSAENAEVARSARETLELADAVMPVV